MSSADSHGSGTGDTSPANCLIDTSVHGRDELIGKDPFGPVLTGYAW